MGQMISLFCLILTANLDTLFLSMSWGLRNRHLTWWGTALIAVVTSVMTWLSLEVGEAAAAFLTETAAKTLAAALLMAIGAWILLKWLKEEGAPSTPDQPITWWDALWLALLLAVNNMGMGLAAGLAGLPPLAAGAVNFVVALLTLWLGSALGRLAAGRWLGRWADCLSGILLILLGAATRWI